MFQAESGGHINDLTIENNGSITNIFHQATSTTTLAIEEAAATKSGRVWFEVPEGIQSIWGRVEFIHQLHQMLQQNKVKSVATILSQLKVVSGMGGIGKTQTALKYILEYGDEYENVIWIQAETNTTMHNSFIRLADRLKVSTTNSTGQPPKLDKIVPKIYARLCADEKSTLFVFDNADDFKSGITDFLPSSIDPDLRNLTILVTSRNQDWSQRFERFQVLPLDVFTPEETLDFILKQLGIPDSPEIRDETREFIQLIGGLPLALQQSLAFIKEKRNLSGQGYNFLDYIIEFKSSMSKILDYEKIPGSPSTIFVTWNVTFQKIETLEDGEKSIEILETLAFFYADKIPVSLIQSIFPELDQGTIFSCLILLENYSLINRVLQDNDHFVSIHRQLQFVILQNIKNSKTVESTYENILDKSGVILKSINFAKCSDILINFHQLVEHPPNFVSCPEKLIDFILDFLSVLFLACSFSGSMNLIIKTCKNFQQQLSANPEKSIILLIKAAEYVFMHGMYNDALSMCENILENMEFHLGPEHASILEVKQILAAVFFKQEKYLKSQVLSEYVLEQQKKNLGENHPLTLDAKQQLANMYQQQGKLSPALEMVEEAEKARVEIFGVDHPSTLDASLSKAILLYKMGQVDNSVDLFVHVYERCNEILGGDHPQTISVLEWIAVVLEGNGNLLESLKLRVETLERRRHVFGDDHPDTKAAVQDVEGLMGQCNAIERRDKRKCCTIL